MRQKVIGDRLGSAIDSTSVSNFFIGAPWKLLCWGLAFVALAATVSILADYNNHVVKFAHEIIRDLGIAFLVGWVIAVVVDFQAEKEKNIIISNFSADARQLIEDASARGLESYLRRDLPPGWFDYIRDSIKQTPFIREGLRVTISMRYPPTDVRRKFNYEDYLVCDQTIRYKVRNISDRESKFPIPVFVELPERRELVDLVDVLNFDINGVALTPDQLKKAREAVEDTETHWTFRHDEVIDRGGELDVHLRIRTARSERNTFVWLNMQPSMGIEVEAQTGDGLTVHLSVIHPDCIPPLVRVASNGASAVVRTTKPVLPFTAVEFRWFPTRSMTTQGAQAS